MTRRELFGAVAAITVSATRLSGRELVEETRKLARRPDPLLTVSQWADRNRILSPVLAGEPGPWRTSRTPYLREIMDCLSPASPVETVILAKGSQIGGTEAANNFLGYVVDQIPGPILVVLPTTETAKRWSKQRFAHVIDSTPCLRGKIAEARSRDSGNTVLLKEFTGGMAIITGANSAVGLRSMPARYTIFDEIDAYPADVDGEGDPVALAEKRSVNFRRRKSLKISTPTIRGLSRIDKEYAASDQRRYFVPCPFCQHFQALKFAQLEYEPKDAPQHVAYRCENGDCGQLIDERWKTQMLEQGAWVPTADHPDLAKIGFPASQLAEFAVPPEERATGYHLSALYSPVGWLSWLDICIAWVKSQNDPALLKVFVNTVLGEVWQDRGESPDWQRLVSLREPYPVGTVPQGGLFLVAGGDVQADRIEVEIVAWGRQRESWSVEYLVLPGDTSTPLPWAMLGKELEKEWPHASGATMPIMALAIDTGFRPQMAYDFALRYPQPAHGQAGSRIYTPRTVVPVKGGDDFYKLIAHVSATDAARKRKGLKIVTVGTAWAKQDLYDHLRANPPTAPGEPFPPGYCHFPQDYEREFFRGLCSERRVIRQNGEIEWVKDPAVRNEPLDCRVYARAAAALCGMDRASEKAWRRLEAQLEVLPRPKPAPQAVSAPAAPPPATVARSVTRGPDWIPDRDWFS
jgi:phage terminase large subunit GpA-like protein